MAKPKIPETVTAKQYAVAEAARTLKETMIANVVSYVSTQGESALVKKCQALLSDIDAQHDFDAQTSANIVYVMIALTVLETTLDAYRETDDDF